MLNAKWLATDLEHGPHEWRRAWHRGHVDAQNTPDRWPRDYDKMNKTEQIGYEQGRLWLRNIVAAGLPVPVWRGDKAGCRTYDKTRYASASSVGSPMPSESRKRSPMP